MKIKGLLALATTATVTIALMSAGAPGANAAPRSAAQASVTSTTPDNTTTPASCDSPPDSPDATTANRDRFITLWAPRLADKTWFNTFANSTTVSSDILAEGFHAMDPKTQSWLVSCLIDNVLAAAGQSATVSQLTSYQIGVDLVIFGKSQLAATKDQLNKSAADQPPAPTTPIPQGMTATDLNATSQSLANAATISTATLPKVDAVAPTTSSSSDLASQTSARLQSLVGAPKPVPVNTKPNIVGGAAAAEPKSTPTAINPNSLFDKLQTVLSLPLVALVLQALADVEQLIANIEQVLFTLPVVNILAAAFYRVCAESATQPLSCSISLPVGVPIPTDVNGDNFPDVLCELLPTLSSTTGGVNIGVNFSVTRIGSYSALGPLPAHVFAVYDTPLVNKRIEYGYDGRASTLANNTNTQFVLHNAVAAATGDIHVSANIASMSPGSTEGITFAIKSLVGGSVGHPPTEADPTAGSVQFFPFPQTLKLDAHLTHAGGGDEDNFSINSSTASTVNAVIDQDTTTTSPKSHREFTALIDKMPTSVAVDLKHVGKQQTITYSGSATIAHVQATDTDTPDTSHPGSYTRSVYDVQGVPTSVQVTLQGAQDILYTASSKVTQVTFSTQTLIDSVLQQEITAQAHQIPTLVHVSDTTGADQTAITYDANDVLPDVAFTMYDLTQDQTNLTASATSIPTHMAFTQTKSTGVYDFTANAGIGRINASLTRGGGTILPLPGDHATVYKRGTALGLDFQLSGFQSAHFDGSQKTIVTLGLSPGGQSFDAVADLDSPNILATVHVSQLPATIAVVIDPVGGSATYNASSIIPDLHGTFTQRDTGTVADLALTQLPKNITLTFNTSGAAPQITYVADSRLGSINGFYQAAPNGLSFHAVISDLPQYMHIGGADPIVFDARSAATDPAGSSYLGQVLFDYATDGVFSSPPTTDDHISLDTSGGATHAELLYTGLQFLSVNTSGGQLHAEIRNVSARLLRAYVTTDTLTLTAFVDKVPADIKVDQVGNDIKYTSSSPINEVYTNLHRTGGDAITADVQGIPQNVDLLFDAVHSHLGWNASSTTGSISVQAHLTAATLNMSRDFDAGLTITGIPAQWGADFGSGNVGFTTTGTGIASIVATVTNHTTFHTLSGDHLSAYYNQGTGDLDASLQISNLTQATFSKITDGSGGGFVADLNMGNHGTFNFGAEVHLTGTDLLADGNFTHLPSTIHLRSDGGRIQYTGNDNPTLTLSVGAGDPASLAATPAPANVHGVSIRDGSVGGGLAVRANLFITGLPDSLDLNSPAGTYTVSNFHPTQDPLTVDVKLTTLTSQPISLYLTQVIGTSSPVSFTFGPFLSSTSGDGTHSLSLSYTSTRDLGALNAEATYGTDDAKLSISEIPSSITVSAALGQQKSITVAMAHGISDITASYKHTSDISFDASVHLNNVPSTVNLLIGKAESASGDKTVDAPDFTFNASSAGMNIDAMATADITSPADITAAVQLTVTNLGKTVTGSLNGTTVHITSSPATGSFLLQAAARIQVSADLSFGNPSDFGFYNVGTLGVDAKLKSVTLGFSNASNLQLDLGITTGLQGDFSNFTFGEDSDTTVHIYDAFNLHIDFGIGSADIRLITIDNGSGGQATWHLGNVIDHFHLDQDQTNPIFHIPAIEFVVANCGPDVTINPSRYGDSVGSTLSLGPPPASDRGSEPSAWLITPDPSIFGITLPDFALDVIAYFETPYDHHIGAGFSCDWGPF